MDGGKGTLFAIRSMLKRRREEDSEGTSDVDRGRRIGSSQMTIIS